MNIRKPFYCQYQQRKSWRNREFVALLRYVRVNTQRLWLHEALFVLGYSILLTSLGCKSDFKKSWFPQTHSVQVYWSPIFMAVSRFEWSASRSTRFFRRTDTCYRSLSCQILSQVRCFSLLRSLVLSISLAIPSPCTLSKTHMHSCSELAKCTKFLTSTFLSWMRCNLEQCLPQISGASQGMFGGPAAFLVIWKNILFLSALCIRFGQSMHVQDNIFL